MKRSRLLLSVLFMMQLPLAAQNFEKKNSWSDFQKDFPGKNVVKWDSNTNAPKRIMGNNIFLTVRSIQKNNVAKHTASFLNKYQDLFNFSGYDLKLEEVVEFDNYFLLTYQQYYKDVEVMNAELKIKVTPEGKVPWISSNCSQDIKISEKPNISLTEAQKIVLSRYDVQSNESQENGKLVVFRNPETDNLNLCWNLVLINKEKNLHKILLIDANTGKIILEYNSFVNEDVNGNAKIATWNLQGMSGGSPDVTLNCQDLTVTVTGVGSTNTDQNGNYSVTVPSSGNYTVTSSLDGPHAYVYNYTGDEASYTGTASTSTDHNWTWQESGHYNEYFVFYYMNNAWHKFSSDVAGFSSNYWNTNKMHGYANYGTGVNGSASGTYMTITVDNHYGGSVYHEYSHNVNYRACGGWIGWPNAYSDGYAMDEGFADYFSCTFRNDSYRYAVGRNLGTKIKYYPPGPPNDASHEGHTRGQIIGGACWDLRNKSGVGVNYANGKVYQVIAGLSFFRHLC